MSKFITAKEAVKLIQDGDSVAVQERWRNFRTERSF